MHILGNRAAVGRQDKALELLLLLCARFAVWQLLPEEPKKIRGVQPALLLPSMTPLTEGNKQPSSSASV